MTTDFRCRCLSLSHTQNNLTHSLTHALTCPAVVSRQCLFALFARLLPSRCRDVLRAVGPAAVLSSRGLPTGRRPPSPQGPGRDDGIVVDDQRGVPGRRGDHLRRRTLRQPHRLIRRRTPCHNRNATLHKTRQDKSNHRGRSKEGRKTRANRGSCGIKKENRIVGLEDGRRRGGSIAPSTVFGSVRITFSRMCPENGIGSVRFGSIRYPPSPGDCRGRHRRSGSSEYIGRRL